MNVLILNLYYINGDTTEEKYDRINEFIKTYNGDKNEETKK